MAFDHAADIGASIPPTSASAGIAGGNPVGPHSLRGDPARSPFQLLLYPGLWPAGEHTQSRKDRGRPHPLPRRPRHFQSLLAADGHPEAHCACVPGARTSPARPKPSSSPPA